MRTRRRIAAAVLSQCLFFVAIACDGEPGAVTAGAEILLPPGASTPSLHVSAIGDLSALSDFVDGAGLVAASQCEPAGTVLPEGTRLRWTLATEVQTGTRLTIVVADEVGRRWLDTGEEAVVEATQRHAAGFVRHFSKLGVSTQRPSQKFDPGGAAAAVTPPNTPSSGPAAATGGPSESQDQDRRRYVYLNLARAGRADIAIVHAQKRAEVQRIYEAFVATAGENARMDVEVMRRLYGVGDYATVKSLIEDGVVKGNHSLDMADLRTALILETQARICEEHGWKLYRSDSGNQSSGMRSDIDQTIYVYKRDAHGNWIRSEADDARFIDIFQERFPQEARFTLASLDVATIAGKDKFPDPRRSSRQIEAGGGRPFSEHAATTMEALRKTPGAYTYCGAVVQQMQLRAMESIERQLRGDGAKPGVPREAHPRLAPLLGDNGVNNLVCLAIGPDGEGRTRPLEVSIEEARHVMFDGLSPALRKGHAYDASIANYLEYMHHLADAQPAVKYLLRALDDGVGTLRHLDRGAARVEYASLDPALRRARLEALLGADAAVQPFLDRWKVVFDACAELRLKHKKGELTEADVKKALEPIARELAGGDGTAWEGKLADARKEFDRRAQEFMLHNAISTATDRVLEFATYDPDDPQKRPRIETEADERLIREALGLGDGAHDAEWGKVREEVFRNQADLARLQLLYSFREMRPDVVDAVLKQAEARGMKPAELARIRDLAVEARSIFFGWRRYQEFKPLYHAYWLAAGKVMVKSALANFQEHLLVQSGFIDTDAGRKPASWFGAGRLGDVDLRVQGFFKRNRVAGIASRYLRGAVFDVGNVDGVLAVLRTWSASGDDPDATQAALIRESISALPVIGQAYTILSSDTVAQGAQSATIMVVCLLVPQAGVAALALSVTENGLALYESEVSRPLVNTVADALYHGYVGPSLYAYEKVPPEFTSTDAASLASHERLAEAQKQASDPAGQKALAEHLIEVRTLRRKRADWEAHDADRRRRQTYEGSGLFGTGAQWTQRRLEGPTLLDRVEPMIFHAPSAEGPVDFTLKPLSDAEEQRRAELEREVAAESVEGVSWQDALVEFGRLEERKQAVDRAQRYLERAAVNHELMHQIRRDSIWPWLATRTTDRSMVDARAFAQQWCRDNRDAVVTALTKVEVDTGDVIPAAAVEELGTRLLDDLERSRMLWASKLYLEEEQRKAEEERIDRRKGAWLGEALAKAAIERPVAMLSDSARSTLSALGASLPLAASLAPLAAALAERHVPIAAPEIEVSVRKVELERAADARPEAPATYEFRYDVKVTADPAVHRGDYRTAAFQLDPATAGTAASQKQFRGLPLDETVVATLRSYVRQSGPPDPNRKSVDPLVLVFVFCDHVALPERVMGATVATLHLPPKLPIPGQEIGAYLLGSVAFAPEPGPVPEGPLAIEAAPVKGVLGAVVINSKALAALDPRSPDIGVRFTLHRSPTPDGPFESLAAYSFTVFPDTPRWTPPDERTAPQIHAYLADGRVWLCDNRYLSHDPGAARRPFHYFVTQVAVVGRSKPQPQGEEERSNVVDPGAPRIVVFVDRSWDGKVRDPSYDNEGGCSVRAALGWTAQPMREWGVEIRMTDRYGVRRFWSPRREGDLEIGRCDAESWAAGTVYVGPAGGTITIDAEGPGGRASLPWTLPADPARVAEMAARLEREKVSTASDAAAEAQQVEAAKARRDQRKPWLSEPPADRSESSMLGFAQALEREDSSRFGDRLRIEYYAPLESARDRRREAILAMDFAQALVFSREAVAAADRLAKVYEENRVALDKLDSAYAAVPAVSEDARSSVANARRAISEQKERIPTIARSSQRDAWTWVAEAAWFAADAASFREAMEAMLQLSDRRDEVPDRIAVIGKTLDRFVSLTGDRARGAILLRERVALERASVDAATSAAVLEQYRRSLPAWWPVKTALE
jgi:hypothetical protein